MANFLTRVELHDADEDDYDTLHAAMAAEGFRRTITGSSGITYRLPPAEYTLSGLASRLAALEKAKRAAGKTGCKAAILVAQTAGYTWWGLDKVKP